MPATISEQVSRLAARTTDQPPTGIMRAFTREQVDLATKGSAVGIIEPRAKYYSCQTPDGSLSILEKHGLTFTVLPDSGNQVAMAVGILTGPSDEASAAQLQFGLDLTAVNACGTTPLPMPTMIIVEADHVIGWIDVHPDHSTRSEPDKILAVVDALASR